MLDLDESEETREAKVEWGGETLGPTPDRFREWKEEFTTGTGGNVVKRLYTPDDADVNYDEDVGLPGKRPYTRGVYPTMHRGWLWTMRQYTGFGTVAETSEWFHYLIDNGSSGLSLTFDLPAQMGYDSDAMMAVDEVGKSGVAVDSLHDIETVFDDTDLGEVSTLMITNAPAAVLLVMYATLGDKQGVPREELRGTIQNDVMKEYIARSLYTFPLESLIRLITDIFEFCAAEMSKLNIIFISGCHICEAGSTVAQEATFTFGNGIQYVEVVVDAGLDMDDFASQLSFFFNAHNNIFGEVVRFRAARRMRAKIIEECFGAENLKPIQLKFHTQTGGSALTTQQVENNVVRVAYQVLTAVLGDTQLFHTNGKDEALSFSMEKSVRTALRIQQILAYESDAADTTDPLAGSYYAEALTDDIGDEALDLLDEVGERGGMLDAVKNRWIQREIQDVVYECQREIEEDERVIVSVNEYQVDEEPTVEVQEVSEEEEQKRVGPPDVWKDDRGEEAVEAALEDICAVANGDENLLPLIITAVRAYAMVGEICGVLREESGEYEPGMI